MISEWMNVRQYDSVSLQSTESERTRPRLTKRAPSSPARYRRGSGSPAWWSRSVTQPAPTPSRERRK